MKLSEAIKTFEDIMEIYGDISITGGYMADDTPLREIIVTDDHGMEIYPSYVSTGTYSIGGVFLSA